VITEAASSPGRLPPLLLLYTPAEAAGLLAVRESWLRRRATARTVPCTFLGKHLRFSRADVVAIAAAGAHLIGPARPARRRVGCRQPAATRPPCDRPCTGGSPTTTPG
jgi:excisionase family DNA binding protein